MRVKLPYIVIGLAILIGVFIFFTIAYGADTTTMRVQNTFEQWCYQPTQTDISYWKSPTKTNQYGTLEQNLERRALQHFVLRLDENNNVMPPCMLGGAFLPSRFKTTLNGSLASGVTGSSYRIGLSSKTTFDGHILVTSDFGTATSTTIIPFHINSGASTDELITCKGISATSSAAIDCTRGVNFYNLSSDVNNSKAHSSGETVIISNDIHFISYNYLGVYDDGSIKANWNFSPASSTVFSIGDGTSAYDKRIVAHNGSSPYPYIGYSASSSKWFISNNGVDYFDPTTGGSGLTAERPISIIGGAIKLATTTGSGLKTDSSGNLMIKASTTAGISIDDNGVYVNQSDSFNWTAPRNTTTYAILQHATTSDIDLTGNIYRNGNIWNPFSLSSTTPTSTSVTGQGATATLETYPISANAIGTTGLIKIELIGTQIIPGSGGSINIQYDGQNACTFSTFAYGTYWIGCDIIAWGSQKQIAFGTARQLDGTGNRYSRNSLTVDSTLVKNLTVQGITDSNNSSAQIMIQNAIVYTPQ